MSWDCRTITINVMVNTHDDYPYDREGLVDAVQRRVRAAVESVVDDLQIGKPDTAEIEVI